MSAQNTPKDRYTPEDLDALSPFPGLANEQQESRTWRRSIGIAVLFHIVLLAVSLPQLQSIAEPEAPKKPETIVIRTPLFKPPEPPKTDIPPMQKRQRIPMPDPTPDEPDEIPVDFVPEDVVFDDVDIVFNIPEAPPAPELDGPIRVGGNVQKPELLHQVRPLYTEIARRARIEGSVILEATIDQQGLVRDVKVLKGLPMGLTEEAVKAVKQWRYSVSTLNGKPVDVLFALTVHFKLQ